MSRKPDLLVALCVCIALQAWLIYRMETRMPVAPRSSGDAASVSAAVANPRIETRELSHDDTHELLRRIDARLAALEADRARAAPVPSPSPIVAGSPDALAADRKLASLLPPGEMTPQELLAFQAELGRFPPEESRQLSAALARAVNAGRVRTR